MQMSRWSTFPSYVVMLACLAAPVLDASAAEIFPDKPIRMVVGFGTGGSADVLARLLAPKLSEQLGQPMVVENRPGASGAIATERVATAPGDGYTLLLMTVGDTVIPALRIKLPALLAQGVDARTALRHAVCVHGAAADALVAQGLGPLGVVASDLPDAARALVNAAARAARK